MEPIIKIRGYHTDSYQHVNNSRYLEFLEEGRWQLFEDYLYENFFKNNDYFSYVVNINISYIQQLKIGDIIIIKSYLESIGNKSAVLKQQIFNKNTGEIAADAQITFVIADKNKKTLKIEGKVKELLLKLPQYKEI